LGNSKFYLEVALLLSKSDRWTSIALISWISFVENTLGCVALEVVDGGCK